MTCNNSKRQETCVRVVGLIFAYNKVMVFRGSLALPLSIESVCEAHFTNKDGVKTEAS